MVQVWPYLTPERQGQYSSFSGIFQLWIAWRLQLSPLGAPVWGINEKQMVPRGRDHPETNGQKQLQSPVSRGLVVQVREEVCGGGVQEK